MNKLPDKYKTIGKPAEGLYKAKGSKFIAYAYPILSVEAIKPILEILKTEHKKARHFCYAYKLGFDDNLYRANDDGEPSGSAGKPIFGKIRSYELTNVFIVVVRYFGGTLLGVPGLIKAYGTAAEEAIKLANIEERIVKLQLKVKFSYNEMNKVMTFLKKINAVITHKIFESICEINFTVPIENSEAILLQFDKMDHVKTENLGWI